jgi:tRNA pseudouridine38-40 synthase
MVRVIAGTLLRFEQQSRPPHALTDLIASGDRRLAGEALPPHGLFLQRVDYADPL